MWRIKTSPWTFPYQGYTWYSRGNRWSARPIHLSLPGDNECPDDDPAAAAFHLHWMISMFLRVFISFVLFVDSTDEHECLLVTGGRMCAFFSGPAHTTSCMWSGSCRCRHVGVCNRQKPSVTAEMGRVKMTAQVKVYSKIE